MFFVTVVTATLIIRLQRLLSQVELNPESRTVALRLKYAQDQLS
jgi:hypothetical protein